MQIKTYPWVSSFPPVGSADNKVIYQGYQKITPALGITELYDLQCYAIIGGSYVQIATSNPTPQPPIIGNNPPSN
jgi:hypothetical protein